MSTGFNDDSYAIAVVDPFTDRVTTVWCNATKNVASLAVTIPR